MIGNDYKRLRQDDEEEDNTNAYDPLIGVENGSAANNHNSYEYALKSDKQSIKNRLLGIAIPSTSKKYSSTVPSTSASRTSNGSRSLLLKNQHTCDDSSGDSETGGDSTSVDIDRIKAKISAKKCLLHEETQSQNPHNQYHQHQKSSKIVRNKRCDNSSTDKKLLLSENLSQLTKKKRLIVFLALAILIFCFNSSTILTWTTTEKIPVLHNSHVPGMKDTIFKHSNHNRQFLSSNTSNYIIDSSIDTNKTSNSDNVTVEKVLSPQTDLTATVIAINVTNHDKISNVRSESTEKANIIDINSERPAMANESSATIDILVDKNATAKNNDSTLTTITASANTLAATITNVVASNLSTTTTNSLKSQNGNNTAIPPTPPPAGYLVWSDKCKMPNLDPYAPDVMKYFTRESYEECMSEKPLTSARFNETSKRYVLSMNEEFKDKYTRYGNQLSCCYQEIQRNSTGKKADEKTVLSECLSFKKKVQIPWTTDNILVKCKNGKRSAYIHGHAMMPERPDIRERLDAWKANDTAKPISVLLLGVDSISRINLIRAMPKTAQYLYDNEWFELSGYNKMDDNTFPNLMAILTGLNYTNGYETCKPIVVGRLDKCPMIWKTFEELGYVTAYGEDETSISTFNFAKVGFEKPPTDYYLRPFLIQAEHSFKKRYKSGLTFCLGYQHSADYVYDYALELATRYKDDPFFGLFWANTFSHNSISDCSSMDQKMVEYLEKFSDRGVLNNSVVVFFSDHGMRFGPTRKLFSGHYEERLPFMFVWLPPWLKTKYPELVNGLSVNKNRLTNPFDMHMTLKHILELSGRAKNLPKAPDCPNCQTLLKPVPESRACDEIAIADHWCTCIPFQSIYKKSNIVKKVTNFAIESINTYINTHKNSSIAHLCGSLHLYDVIAAYRALLIGDLYPPNLETYRVVFTTNPGGAMYEATVRRFSDTEVLEVTGSISRLNTYANDAKCISDAGAKKYCHCKKHPSSKAALRAPGG